MMERKWTKEPLRNDGGMIAGSSFDGSNHMRYLVGGRDGQYPTIFVSSTCATKGDVARFEATADRLRDCYNALAGVDDPAAYVDAFEAMQTVLQAIVATAADDSAPQGSPYSEGRRAANRYWAIRADAVLKLAEKAKETP